MVGGLQHLAGDAGAALGVEAVEGALVAAECVGRLFDSAAGAALMNVRGVRHRRLPRLPPALLLSRRAVLALHTRKLNIHENLPQQHANVATISARCPAICCCL